jgi:predicted DNA binding protein
MKLMNGPMSFSNFSTTSSVSTQTFFNVSDGKAYMDLINPTMTTTMNLINSMYKDMDLPITLDMNITKEKEKVANLEVQKITYKADSSLPTGLENMSQYICNDKNTIYMVSNTSSDPTELNELIQTKRSQKPTLSKREGYQKTLEIVKGQKVGFMSMYPIDYIKTTMQQTKTNAGILAGMLVGLEAVLDKLPKSKHTVTFGFDVPTKNTMSMNMNLPALAVQELMMAGMAVQQHFMTSMQNKKPTK